MMEAVGEKRGEPGVQCNRVAEKGVGARRCAPAVMRAVVVEEPWQQHRTLLRISRGASDVSVV
eukprot:711718-Pleurochrysis_carterae.AAC.1